MVKIVMIVMIPQNAAIQQSASLRNSNEVHFVFHFINLLPLAFGLTDSTKSRPGEKHVRRKLGIW